MNHVGDEWMSKVKAIAYNMNSDFEKIKELYPSQMLSMIGFILSRTSKIKWYPRYIKHGNEAQHDELLEEKIYLTIDIFKDLLDQAYVSRDEVEMFVRLEAIIEICQATENSHFIWVARLLDCYLKGIYLLNMGLPTDELESINNKIKSGRRKGQRYQDDEYFSLINGILRKAS